MTDRDWGRLDPAAHVFEEPGLILRQYLTIQIYLKSFRFGTVDDPGRGLPVRVCRDLADDFIEQWNECEDDDPTQF